MFQHGVPSSGRYLEKAVHAQHADLGIVLPLLE
jgi:hypothetical protein